MKKDKSMPRGVRSGMLGSSVALLAAAVALPAHAEYTFYENGGFKANAGLSSILGAVGTNDVGNITSGGLLDTDGNERDGYFEAFLKPNLNFTWDMPTEGTIYGKVSGVGVYQAGDGDPSQATNGDVGDLGLEEAYLGWRGQYLDVRAGRTEFAIGDQFLIGDCNFDANNAGGRDDAHYDGSYWIAPYKACDSSVIVSVNNGAAWRADAFYIKGDRQQAFSRIGGLNVEYLLGEGGADGKFGFMLAAIPEASDFLSRQGMEIVNFRANGIAIPQLPGLKIHGEFVAETGENNSTGVDYDAHAYYGEAEYTFGNVMWSPTIAYRYGHWSGDDDLTDNKQKNFDSLYYYAGPRGWGTWYQGEIAGEYQLFNSNQNTHMVKLRVSPLETLAVTGLYFNHSLDETGQYLGFANPAVTEDGFMDELNLVVEWFPNSMVYLAGVVGYGFVGDGYEQIFSTDEDPMVYELWAQFTF